MKNNFPFISVITPMKNEVNYIEKCINSVLKQDYPHNKIEILIVDGGSTDGSTKVVQKLMKKNKNIKLLGGSGVNCPAGMNIGIKNAKGKLIAKIDSHGYIPPDFLQLAVKYFSYHKKNKVKCVGGPIKAIPKSLTAKSNVLARTSKFGVGGGIYSQKAKSDFTDTVQCGVYQKDIFLKIGLFDETLQFGEDEELNWRIIKAKYKIFYTSDINFYYYPRNTLKKLYLQYYNYGNARIKVLLKFPDFFKIKHMIPAVLVSSLIVSGVLAVFFMPFQYIFYLTLTSYIIASLIMSFIISIKNGLKYFLLLPFSFGALHFGYGFGLINGIIKNIREVYNKLTLPG
ncbi:MAG: glycosyltransferase family 2 protein [bacterium]|nr:glycosyltransferase family 2 protein [bacterium]